MRLLLLTGGKIKQPDFWATAHYLKDGGYNQRLPPLQNNNISKSVI